MAGTDLILIGVVFGFLGSYLLAKGLLFRDPRIRQLESSAFYGTNPFLLKTGIAKEVMTRMSLLAGLLSAICVIVGTFMNLKSIGADSWFMKSWVTLSSFFILSGLLCCLFSKYADVVGMRRQLPLLVENFRKGFEDTLFVFEHGGMEKRHLEKGTELTQEQKAKNMNAMKQRFGRWALLFNIPFDEEKGDYEKLIAKLKVLAESNQQTPLFKFSLSADWVQAIATVILVAITAVYVVYTSDLVKSQKSTMESQQRQFEMLNRPRVIPLNPEGEPSGGQINFANLGNLPAENVSVAWSVFQVSSDGKEGEKDHPVITAEEFAEIAPDDIVAVTYTSPLTNSDPRVFFILGVKYGGTGLSHARSYTDFFFWNIHSNPPYWVRPNPLEQRLVEAVSQRRKAVALFLARSKNSPGQESSS